jgi:TolA-binding protein
MAHPRIVAILLALFSLAAPLLPAQSSTAPSDLKDGIEQFRNGQYDKAILLFHNVILDSTADALKPEAYLLMAKAYIAIGKLAEAERNLEFYLSAYPKAPDYAEAVYQKGRLLFLQEDFDNAIQALQAFIAAFPSSPLVSSAWFWVGESLASLGRLDDAQAVYQKIVAEYPSSFKLEAAHYKVSLIQLRKKEVELSKLLKWSHEDFLKSIEEFQRREKTYEQAIEAYQKRLAGSGITDDQKAIADLRLELARSRDEATALSAQLAKAGSSAPLGVAAPASAETARLAETARVLALKQKALDLKESYIDWLLSKGGAGK